METKTPYCTSLSPVLQREPGVAMERKGQNGGRKFVDVESDSGELIDRGESDWRQDLPSIVLLLILYTLQGIPMGLSGSIPFLLLEKVCG